MVIFRLRLGILVLTCFLALVLVGTASGTVIPAPILENFDTQALGADGWTESGGTSTTPTYNFSTTAPAGCCTPPSPGFISAKDNAVGGTAGLLTLYAPLALFPQVNGFADLSQYDVINGTAFYIQFALEQISNQGNKLLNGNTGKINITGNNGTVIQANLFNFAACSTCMNLPPGWNLASENNLFSAGIFQILDSNGVPIGSVDQALFTSTISAITKFGIEVELHGDASDNVGFDAFGITRVPEPSYSVVLLAAAALGFYFKRRRSLKA